MTTINATMSPFAIERAAVEAKARMLAYQRRQVFLVYVCPVTGAVDAISENDRWQIGEATVLRRIVPERQQEYRSDCYPDPTR